MAILAFLYLLPRIIDNRHMEENKIILTGIKPTGRPHIGNYLGAIEPALRRSLNNPNKKTHSCSSSYLDRFRIR